MCRSVACPTRPGTVSEFARHKHAAVLEHSASRVADRDVPTHWLSFLRDLHNSFAVSAVIFGQNDRAACGYSRQPAVLRQRFVPPDSRYTTLYG